MRLNDLGEIAIGLSINPEKSFFFFPFLICSFSPFHITDFKVAQESDYDVREISKVSVRVPFDFFIFLHINGGKIVDATRQRLTSRERRMMIRRESAKSIGAN